MPTPITNVGNTLNTIRTQQPGLTNEKIDNDTLLEALTLGKEQMLFMTLGDEQDVKRNAGTNTVQWRRYQPLPVATNNGLITEGTNPDPMKIGALIVRGSVAVYGAYLSFTRQTEAYNLDKIKEEYSPLIVEHALETMESIVRDELRVGSGTQVISATNPLGTAADIKATDVLTLRACRLVANQMEVNRRKGHRKTGSNYYLVVTTTEGMSDLLDDEELLKLFMMPGQTNKPVKDNGLQEYSAYNLKFMKYQVIDQTREIQTNAGGIAIHNTYIFGKGAYAVMKLASAGVEYKSMDFAPRTGDNLGQVASIGWLLMGYGAKVLDPLACVKVLHAVKKPLNRANVYANQS